MFSIIYGSDDNIIGEASGSSGSSRGSDDRITDLQSLADIITSSEHNQCYVIAYLIRNSIVCLIIEQKHGCL